MIAPRPFVRRRNGGAKSDLNQGRKSIEVQSRTQPGARVPYSTATAITTVLTTKAEPMPTQSGQRLRRGRLGPVDNVEDVGVAPVTCGGDGANPAEVGGGDDDGVAASEGVAASGFAVDEIAAAGGFAVDEVAAAGGFAVGCGKGVAVAGAALPSVARRSWALGAKAPLGSSCR